MSSCTLFLKAVTLDSWSVLHSLCTTVALYGCKCSSFFASYTDNIDTTFRSASQTNDILRDVSNITPTISGYFLVINVCSAYFLHVWNVTCSPYSFSVLNCHVWNRYVRISPLPPECTTAVGLVFTIYIIQKHVMSH
jgi:hypothetical protein